MNLHKRLLTNPRWLIMLAFAMAVVVFAKLLRPVLAALIEKIPAGTAYDFVLDILPVISSSGIIYVYIYGLAAAIVFLMFSKVYYAPTDLPYTIIVFALAMILADIMWTLTVLGPPHNFVNSWLFFDYNKDLCPSMHVGTMFLGFLVADRRWVKGIMFGATVVIALVVLFMHTHYTLDVLAAFFVIYGIWALCEKHLKNFLRRAYFCK